jgi:Tfp pilus assembly protein PilX
MAARRRVTRGFVLLTVMLVLAVGSVMVASSHEKLLLHTKVVVNHEAYLRCYYNSDAALMTMRQSLQDTPLASFTSGDSTVAGVTVHTTMTVGVPNFSTECQQGQTLWQMTVTVEPTTLTTHWQRL